MLNRKLRVLYPPTVNYNLLFQRPNQILRALARQGVCESYFMNLELPEHIKERFKTPGMVEFEKDFFISNQNISMRSLNPDVFYFSYPQHIHNYLKWGLGKYCVFDAIDAPVEEFRSWKNGYEESLYNADLVMTSSDDLYNSVRFRNDNVVMVKNGVEYSHFQKSTRNPYKMLKDKNGHRLNKKPIIGFSGAIATWVNTDLIMKSCETYPEYNFVIFGLGFNEEIPQHDNLFFLGHKSYYDLPAWINHLDVCTIPFKDTMVTQAANPLKFWEYLASGNPIVTSNLKETKYDYVHWAKNDEEYLKFIEKAVKEKRGGNKNSEKRKSIAKTGDWEERIKPLISFLEGVKCHIQ